MRTLLLNKKKVLRVANPSSASFVVYSTLNQFSPICMKLGINANLFRSNSPKYSFRLKGKFKFRYLMKVKN